MENIQYSSNDVEVREIAESMLTSGVELATHPEIFDSLKVDAELIKIAANELSAYYETMTVLIEHGYKLMKSFASNESDNTSNLINQSLNINRNLTLYEELMKRFFNLQHLMNEFLGQKIEMVFVDVSEDGEVELFTFKESIENLRHGTEKIRYIKNIQNDPKYKSFKPYSEKEYDPSSLNETFKSIHQRRAVYYDLANDTYAKQAKRYNKSHKGKDSVSTDYSNTSFYILWKINGSWDGRLITSYGFVKEAYVNFFLHKIKFMNGLEENVKDFILNNELGVAATDNESGFLTGDISLNGTEYGVKGSSASALGYKEIITKYLDLIKNITDDNAESVIRGIKEELHDKRQNNAVKEAANKVVAKNINKTLFTQSRLKRRYEVQLGIK